MDEGINEGEAAEESDTLNDELDVLLGGISRGTSGAVGAVRSVVGAAAAYKA